MALTVVTAIFGEKFKLYEPVEEWPGCEFRCFTDRTDLRSKHWQIITANHPLSPRRSNRLVKTQLHKFVTGPTLYIDADFKLALDPRPIVEAALEQSTWAATEHPHRDCLFDEAATCVEKRCAEDPPQLMAQIERYESAGMPRHFGLWAGGILARRGDAQSALLGDVWWREVDHGSERDQVSLPYVFWSFDFRPAVIPGVYSAMPWLAWKKH